MTVESDTRFWDKTAKSYSKSSISDQAGYERTLDKTRTFLKPTDRVLELGCGTGTTALLLANGVQSYLGTDISPEMIKIANDKLRPNNALPQLSFRTAAAEELAAEKTRFTAVLGFNYLHLVRDLPGTLHSVRTLLEDGGLFITKTACIGEMNFLLKLVALPVMQAVGKAPFCATFGEAGLAEQIRAAGFDIVATEMHASKGNDHRPYIVARKK
jgi:ubiquinone/menaquinone biosynthesis C-methylase UbiE